MSAYPVLKPGVNFIVEHNAESSSALVGTTNFGVRLSGHSAILFLQKLDGVRELNEIINEIGISNNQALEFLTPLVANNLLNLTSAPAIKGPEAWPDFAQQVAIERLLPELNTISWRKTSAPNQELLARADKEIFILGDNRLAFALFELFQTSGYLNSRMVTNLKGPIPASLIGATPFRMSDIGRPLIEGQDQVKREFGLNIGVIASKELALKTPTKSPLNPSRIYIRTTSFPIEDLPELILDGESHLQISNLTAGKIEIGPIVIPGQTPCYNCIALWKAERSKNFASLNITNELAAPLELPVAAVTLISGLIVSLIDNYFALEKSFLIGSSIVVNLLKPLEYTERFWQPHPRCGCLELL